MTIFTHHVGSADPLIFKPLQPDGTMPDLSDARMELRVRVGGRWTSFPGVPAEDGFAVDLNDLPPHRFVYPARIRYYWGERWTHGGDVKLHIMGET